MNQRLEEAQKILSIRSVTLRNCDVSLNDEIDSSELIKKLNKKEIITQTFRGVNKVREILFKTEDKNLREYNFFYSVGIRLVASNENEDENGSGVYLQITATFNALYNSKKELKKESIEAFSEENVGYNVWPYWREFVQSTCARLDFPTLQIPLYFCKSKKQ